MGASSHYDIVKELQLPVLSKNAVLQLYIEPKNYPSNPRAALPWVIHHDVRLEDNKDYNQVKAMKQNPSALLYPLSLLLVSGAWQGSSDLTCIYDSMETVVCDWTQSRNTTEEQCKLTGHVNSGYQPMYFEPIQSPPQTCYLHGIGTRKSCELIFDEETYSLTVSDAISLVVSCRLGEKWRNDSRKDIKPFENLQLRAPHNVQMESSRKPSYNLTWQLRNVSHYLKTWLEYEVYYKKPDEPDEASTILPINNDQQWVNIETLSPGTVYEAAVRVKVQNISGYKSTWSNWSSMVQWKTYIKVLPEEPSSHISLPLLLTFIISLIFIFFIATVNSQRPKWLQKVLKTHLPDPAKFFPSLTAVHRGDVQKWLSSPLSMDSFHITSASSDVSVLEVLQKNNREPCLLLPKECPIPMDAPETSGHSLSSSFVNRGYFFFHHLHSLEIEPCKVYFTYDPFAQENSGSKNDDSSQVIHTTGDHSPLASYSLMGSQEDVSLLQEMKEPAQKVHQTINPPSMGRAPPALAVKQDETQKESKAIDPASVSPHQSAMGVSNVHKQPSSNTNEIEAVVDVTTHTTSIGGDAPSFFQPMFLNQGKASDLCRTASTGQVPNFEAYVSLRELQSKYSHQSV
ncbi:interleukin-2 receptor subunit beta [Eublepharis macularius]|uniref:Interleukin-2 receptor subunit beta n=1 Tax=Eublepharis macularius TaxID=481883 RepID=A0AA97L646_EUBMA|nr:interleukin-2 receptor subunit beta [Eublepharis macularius]